VSAFDAHPLLLLVLGLGALPLLAEDTRYPTLRWQGWLLPLMGLLGSAALALMLALPGMDAPPSALGMAWVWHCAWLMGPLLLLLLYRRWTPAPRAGLDAWLAAVPLPLFWVRRELWPLAPPQGLPSTAMPLLIGLAAWLLLALLIGAGEKCRLNRQPASLEGLPFRLLLLSLLLLLARGAEALLDGRLP